jgi:hypothetical protein
MECDISEEYAMHEGVKEGKYDCVKQCANDKFCKQLGKLETEMLQMVWMVVHVKQTALIQGI